MEGVTNNWTKAKVLSLLSIYESEKIQRDFDFSTAGLLT